MSAGTALDRIAQAYARAEITTAIVEDRNKQEYVLVYGVAELCPPDQPLSPRIGVGPHFMLRERLEGEELTLYVRRDHVTQADALAFFRGSDGKRAVPGVPPLGSAGQLDDFTRDEEAVLIPSNLADASGVGAMLPRRASAIGHLSKYDTAAATRRRLGQRAMSRVVEALRETLGVDLARFAEHVGAVHLCFANPILRRFERSISGDERTLLVRCYERARCTVAGCEIEIFNEWPSIGTGYRVRHTITAPFFTLPLPAPPQSLRVQLIDTTGRCVEDESATFIRKIRLDVALTARRRIVIVDPSGREETRIVQTTSGDRRAEEDAPLPPLAFLIEAQRCRELDDLAKRRVFLYFPGGEESRTEAREVVRELLGRARTRCDIVDPYLCGDDVALFVPFITGGRCQVRLLSSHAHLRGRDNEGAHREAQLIARIADLRRLPLVIEGKKLAGKVRSPVHDRILAIDDEIYLLGSSLSELGSRATTIFRVPDARRLRAEIETWWGDALPLEVPKDDRTLHAEWARLRTHVLTAARTAWDVVRLVGQRVRTGRSGKP